MSELVTGNAYVGALSTRNSDRNCRAAFLELALTLVGPGSHIFDFGCGPGIDARTYAERGHRVSAYDVDAAMCAHFRQHCANGISAGAIHLIEGTYSQFLQRKASTWPPAELVTANFAPVNLVEDVASLFHKFSTLIQPDGQVLAAVLNPCCAGDVRYGWWWRGLPRLLARGRYALAGAQAPITRWLPGALAAVASDWFELEAIYCPAERATEGPMVRRLRGASPRDWPVLASSRFIFMLFRHRAPTR
jgi:2-polyprenyl-3-methyl-5-hydroxy-6-metoxy-1,4-benzoquinol methylase